MPKQTPPRPTTDFADRLMEILESRSIQRRGAGAYLARAYKVSPVTANAWLNGAHKADPELARRMAEDHGSTFEYLYFGQQTNEQQQGASNALKRESPPDLAHATPRTASRVRELSEKIRRADPLTDSERSELVNLLAKVEALKNAAN